MVPAKVLLVVSLLTLVTGLSLVVVFSFFFVAPTVSASALLRTQCFVDEVSTQPISVNSSFFNCSVVRVTYNFSNGYSGSGYLRQHHVLSQGCHAQEQMLPCFQSSCSDYPSEPSEDPPPDQGDSIRCYYRPDSSLTGPQYGRFLLLQLMFWPTMLFIGGFVSLFFACLQLTVDKWSTDHGPSTSNFAAHCSSHPG